MLEGFFRPRKAQSDEHCPTPVSELRIYLCYASCISRSCDSDNKIETRLNLSANYAVPFTIHSNYTTQLQYLASAVWFRSEWRIENNWRFAHTSDAGLDSSVLVFSKQKVWYWPHIERLQIHLF